MSLRLEDIQAFLNVVELGSISAAAERMSLSKSVISKRVSDLERHLGVPVADRTSPVQRGKWVMEVMLNSPPPPPPTN